MNPTDLQIDDGTAEITRQPGNVFIGYIHVRFDSTTNTAQEFVVLINGETYPLRGRLTFHHLVPHDDVIPDTMSADDVLSTLHHWAEVRTGGAVQSIQGTTITVSATPNVTVPSPISGGPPLPPLEPVTAS